MYSFPNKKLEQARFARCSAWALDALQREEETPGHSPERPRCRVRLAESRGSEANDECCTPRQSGLVGGLITTLLFGLAAIVVRLDGIREALVGAGSSSRGSPLRSGRSLRRCPGAGSVHRARRAP